jgi:uncharacterized protein (TIGR03086 family)
VKSRVKCAWPDPHAWERDLNIMGSPAPAAEVAAGILAEMVLHSWDVARASGQEYSCGADVAAAVLRAVQANAELFRQYKGFADPVPVPQAAPVLDRALALSGRDPQWAPAGRAHGPRAVSGQPGVKGSRPAEHAVS